MSTGPTLSDLGRELRLVFHRAWRDWADARGGHLAASLAYASLLSFVPLVASVTVLTSTLFGDPGTGLYRLIRVLVPGASREVVQDLQMAAAQARAISGLAGAIFLLTSFRMFFTLEGAVNALWGITVRRPALKRVGSAVVVVVLGPVALGILTSFVLEHGGVRLRAEGLLLAASILTLLYRIVPAAHVRWRPAIVTGIGAGAALMLLRSVFTSGVRYLTAISQVYGSISAIFVLVIAMGFVWIVLLFGVTFAHALQFRHELVEHDQPDHAARRASPLHESVRLLLAVAWWNRRSEGASLIHLAEEIHRTLEETEMSLQRLAGGGLIARDWRDEWHLTRAPAEISLYTVARVLGEYVPRPLPLGDDPEDETLRIIFLRTDREVRSVLQGTSLQDLARHVGK